MNSEASQKQLLQVERAEVITKANRYLKTGFRSSIVRIHTDLPMSVIRALVQKLNNESKNCTANTGQLPTTRRVLKGLRSTASAASFVTIYKQYADLDQSIDIENVIKAYTAFSDYHEKIFSNNNRPFDINSAWVLVRDIRSKTASVHVCDICSCDYLYIKNQDHLFRCPWCLLNSK